MQMRLLIFGLFVIPLFTGCGQQPASGKASTDTTADTAAMRATVEKFVAAWNKGDSATYGALIAGDAVLMPPDGPVVTGRDAIVAAMAKDYDPRKAQQTATVDEVIVAGPDTYAYGAWNVKPTAAASADAKVSNGKWSALYHRSADGTTWLISRWMWNQEAAPKASGG